MYIGLTLLNKCLLHYFIVIMIVFVRIDTVYYYVAYIFTLPWLVEELHYP